MNIEHLNYLVTVADCGSIHEASRRLLLKQSYLSNVIKSLEQFFDTQIFDRHSKGVTPTINGQYLIDQARTILNAFENMTDSYRYPDNKKLLDCTETISLYMPPYLDNDATITVLEEFKEYFPNVTVTVNSRQNKDDYPVLLKESASLVFFLSQTPLTILQEKLAPELVCQAMTPIPLALFASQNNPEAKKYPVISVEKALTLPLALLTPQVPEASPIYQTIQSYGTPNIQYIVDNPMTLFRLLQKNYCFIIGKYDVLANDSSIVRIPFQEPLQMNLFLICHQNTLNSYAVNSLIKLLKKQQDVLLN